MSRFPDCVTKVFCRSGDTQLVYTASQSLTILMDTPHMRQDALAAGAVHAVVQVLACASEDIVTDNQEMAAVILSKYALEPEAHGLIATAGAVPVRIQTLRSTAGCCPCEIVQCRVATPAI